MKVRWTRVLLAISMMAAMALSTGAGIRWGFSAQVVAPPVIEQPADLAPASIDS